MNPLQTLAEALDGAQNELKSAEIALLEAKVRAEEARMAESRLAAAVAALKGEIPSPESALRADEGSQLEEGVEKSRKEVNSAPNNPYGHLKCSGCGVQGNMVPGAHGMFVCQTCGNMVG